MEILYTVKFVELISYDFICYTPRFKTPPCTESLINTELFFLCVSLGSEFYYYLIVFMSEPLGVLMFVAPEICVAFKGQEKNDICPQRAYALVKGQTHVQDTNQKQVNLLSSH